RPRCRVGQDAPGGYRRTESRFRHRPSQRARGRPAGRPHRKPGRWLMSHATRDWDSLWLNVHLPTLRPGAGYGEITDGAIAVHEGKIAWIGPRNALPAGARAGQEHDGGGAWLTPGLIDCHTHAVYAGNRSDEWEARLNGVPYEQIARQGGGIVSTVRATRVASFDELLQASLPRVHALMAEGVTTLEIKSGYGLDLEI